MGAIKSDYKFADLSGGTYAFGCIQHKTGRTKNTKTDMSADNNWKMNAV